MQRRDSCPNQLAENLLKHFIKLKPYHATKKKKKKTMLLAQEQTRSLEEESPETREFSS